MGPFPKNVSYRIKSVRKKLILVSLTIKIKSMLLRFGIGLPLTGEMEGKGCANNIPESGTNLEKYATRGMSPPDCPPPLPLTPLPASLLCHPPHPENGVK